MPRPATFLLALVTAANAPLAAAAPPAFDAEARGPATRVACSLDVAGRRIEGRTSLRLTNPGSLALDRIYVWLYANHTAVRPDDLDDLTHHWYYPDRFDPGEMSIAAVAVAGRTLAPAAWRSEPHGRAGDRVLWSIALPAPLAPGHDLVVEIDYRGHLPQRYGSFGCVDEVCTLAGGFYPALAYLDAAGWDLAAGPRPGVIELELTLARRAAVIAFGVLLGEPGRRFRARAGRAGYATIVVAPRWYRTERRTGQVVAEVYATREPPPTEAAREQLLPYTQEPFAAYAAEVAGDALSLARGLGVGVAKRVALVEVPLRRSLAEPHPGLTLVSDRWYRVWPAERVRKFHARALARAVFTAALTPMILARTSVAARDAPWLAELFAAYLTDRYTLARFARRERAGEILAPFRFVPTVDQLLYAPQIGFADAFFGPGDAAGAAREGPDQLASLRVPGGKVYEALADLLTPAMLSDALTASLIDGQPLEDAAAAAYGAPLDAWFRQWRQPPAAVDYRLESVTSRWIAGAGYRHELRVARAVTGSGPVAVEPVEVVAIERAGASHRLRWDGEGGHTTLRLTTPTPLALTELDPRLRLAQATTWDSPAHPREGDRRPARLRLVYNSFGVLLNVTDLSALLAADFSLSRAYDLRRRLRLVVYSSASTVVGGAASYVRGFGPKVTPDRLLASAMGQLSVARLRDEFFGGDDSRGALRASLSASLGASDRVYLYEPRRSRDGSVGAAVSATRLDPDADRRAATRLSGQLSARYARLWTPIDGHTLAAELSSATVVGQLEQRNQLLAGGGVGGSRGYGPGELFGRLRFDLHLEYRHVFDHTLDWNFGHFSIVRGLGGVAFADVVALSPERGYGLDGRRDLYPSLGYGLRVFYDSFGAVQQLLRLDVAVRVDDSLAGCLRGRSRVCPAPAVYLSFVPPF